MNFGAFVGGLGEGAQSAQDQAMKQQKQAADIAYQQALMQNMQARQKLDEDQATRDAQTHQLNMDILGIEAAHGNQKAQDAHNELTARMAQVKSATDVNNLAADAARAAGPYTLEKIRAEAAGAAFKNSPAELTGASTLAEDLGRSEIGQREQLTRTSKLQGQVNQQQLAQMLQDPSNRYIQASKALSDAEQNHDSAGIAQAMNNMESARSDYETFARIQHPLTADQEMLGWIPEQDRGIVAKTALGLLPKASGQGNPQANKVALEQLKSIESGMKEVDAARRSKNPSQAATVEKTYVDAFNKSAGTSATSLADAYGLASHMVQNTTSGADTQNMIGGAGSTPTGAVNTSTANQPAGLSLPTPNGSPGDPGLPSGITPASSTPNPVVDQTDQAYRDEIMRRLHLTTRY